MMLLLDLMNFTLRCLKSSAVATPESHLWHLKMASKMLFPIKINQKHIKIWPDLAEWQVQPRLHRLTTSATSPLMDVDGLSGYFS